MDRDMKLIADSYNYSHMISEGLERNDIRSIENGLSHAYDLFVEYVLEDRHDKLVTLGRDLNAAYFPHLSEIADLSSRTNYLGQIRALINLCDYIAQSLVPDRLWHVISRSKYAKPILQALLKNGALLASDLRANAGLAYATELSRIVKPLVDEGLVRREKFGKNVWYSLASSGRLMAGRYFGTEDTKVIESTLPIILAKLMEGWQNLNDLFDAIHVNIRISELRSLISSILSAFREAGIVEEKAENWRIPSRRTTKVHTPADAPTYFELTKVASLIEKEYEQSRISHIVNRDELDKARSILDRVEVQMDSSGTEQAGMRSRLGLERAKYSALNGDFEAALSLIQRAHLTAKTHCIDTEQFQAEEDRIWTFVQTGCIRPKIENARRMLAKGRYYDARDLLLEVYNIYQKFGSPLTDTDLASEVCKVGIDTITIIPQVYTELGEKLDKDLQQHTQDADREEHKPPSIRKLPGGRLEVVMSA